MKKLLSILIISSTILASSLTAYAKTSFSDIKENDWFYGNVITLVEMGGISGYPDGTFKPENNITYAEYLTILVKATNAGSGNYVANPNGNWYDAVVSAGYESGIIPNNRTYNFNAPITRSDAAMFTELAVQNVLGEKEVYIKDIENLIGDYDSFKDTGNAVYIVNQYERGILTGSDSKGTFNASSNLTRAEAATIILKTAKPEMRKDMSTVDVYANVSTPQIIQSGQHKGKLSSKYARELDLKALSSTRFYKENGQYYISMDLPELPDGFTWNVHVVGVTNDNKTVFETNTNERVGMVRDVTINGSKVLINPVSLFPDQYSMNAIARVVLTVTAYNKDGGYVVEHKIFNNSNGQVQESRSDISDVTFVDMDTTGIYNW